MLLHAKGTKENGRNSALVKFGLIVLHMAGFEEQRKHGFFKSGVPRSLRRYPIRKLEFQIPPSLLFCLL